MVINIDFFYHGPTPPSNVFAAFMSIPSLSNTTKTQRYPQLLTREGTTSAVGLRMADAFNSFPNMPTSNTSSFIEWQYNEMAKPSFFTNSLEQLGIELFTMTIQPVSIGFQNASKSSGPGAIALDPNNGDKLWFEYDVGWKTSSCDEYCPAQLMAIVDSAVAYQKQTYAGIKPTHYVSGDLSFAP